MCLSRPKVVLPPPAPPPPAAYKDPLPRDSELSDEERARRRRLMAGVATSNQGVQGPANVVGQTLLGAA